MECKYSEKGQHCTVEILTGPKLAAGSSFTNPTPQVVLQKSPNVPVEWLALHYLQEVLRSVLDVAERKIELSLCCNNHNATKTYERIGPQIYNQDTEWRRVGGFTFRSDYPWGEIFRYQSRSERGVEDANPYRESNPDPTGLK
jgi:hypothetical protein